QWRPNVLKFSLNLLGELQPRAITRDLDWGVPIPLAGWDDLADKRIYVWFDAVIGYLSASIEWARRSGDPDAWRAWWESPDAESYYFMGKDNIVYRAGAPAGNKGHPLPRGRVPPPQQRRAGRHLGEPGEPLGVVRGQEHRLGPGARRTEWSRPGDPGALPPGLRPGRRGAGPGPVQGGGQRRHARRRRGQQVHVRPGAVEAARVRPGADAHDHARGPAAGRRRQDHAHPVPARVLGQGLRDAGRRGHLDRHAEDRRGGRGRRPAVPGG